MCVLPGSLLQGLSIAFLTVFIFLSPPSSVLSEGDTFLGLRSPPLSESAARSDCSRCLVYWLASWLDGKKKGEKRTDRQTDGQIDR